MPIKDTPARPKHSDATPAGWEPVDSPEPAGWEPVDTKATGWEAVPKFDPNQPYEPLKFNPNDPYEHMPEAPDPYASMGEPSLDYTSNPRGEGLYEMAGPDGTIKVPFSKVMDASHHGYRLATPKETVRWAKDARALNDVPWYKQHVPLEYGDPNHPWSMREAGKALHNVAAGAVNLVLHPIEAAESTGTAMLAGGMSPSGYPMFGPTLNPERDKANEQIILNAQEAMRPAAEDFRKHPLENLESMLGQAAVMEAARVLPGVARTVGGKTIRAVTATGPEVATKLASDVADANAKESATSEHMNAKAAEQHLEKTQDALHEQHGKELEHQYQTAQA